MPDNKSYTVSTQLDELQKHAGELHEILKDRKPENPFWEIRLMNQVQKVQILTTQLLAQKL